MPRPDGKQHIYLHHTINLRFLHSGGTGLYALPLAASLCREVDLYGFTVDLEMNDWTRYHSEGRKGHGLKGASVFYQLLECLGMVKLNSPKRSRCALAA
mmetsp:Transcript_24135/g.75751  ORF Transcript_24135/g.75751 Transcript_24135/m.75751 type:complete len:99 (-) Transcript_24135:351-647(-)